MTRVPPRTALAAALALLIAPATAQSTAQPTTQPVDAGTDSAAALAAPDASDSFTFVVFPDRTGGPASGVRVLEKAVETAAWLDPDLVMTVGDLIEGYGPPEPWLEQMREYKSVMARLPMPWYPVAGNHDLYARPHTDAGHADLYREHFGPLYYAFTHKFARFIVLFSDEAMSFRDPANTQNMSDEQLAWLRDDLAASDAERVFVFIHHPRWLDRYEGSNWPQVHRVLADHPAPVTVFAGHVHHIRDDGVVDGVRYLTLGTLGAHPSRQAPHASIDHVTLVHARPDRESVVHVPIGAVHPGSDFPGWESDEIRTLQEAAWIDLQGRAEIAPEPGRTARVTAVLTNPTRKPLEIVIGADAPDGWTLVPRETRAALAPGQRVEWAFDAVAPALADQRPELTLRVRARYPLTTGEEQPVSIRLPVPVDPVLPDFEAASTGEPPDGFLRLNGRSALRVHLDQRPETFTLEAWARGATPRGRQGLIANTESSGFGLFWSDAPAAASLPTGYAHAGAEYARAEAQQPWDWARWTHLALVFDGRTLSLFVDGRLAESAPAKGALDHNSLPLMIGADVDTRGQPTSYWTGDLDEVRLSRTARYDADFTPPERHARDDHTLLLLRFDHDLGPVFPDASPARNHAWAAGSPEVVLPAND
jgi:hypothetical protein